MQPRPCIATFFTLRFWLCGALLLLAVASPAASLQTFAVVFGQLTNDIAIIEQDFDNSPGQKQALAALIRARGVILNPDLRDDQTLAVLVGLLGENSAYDSTLDESARNARAAVLSDYDAIGMRVADLPPSGKATLAASRFNDLSAEANALSQEQRAGGISSLLAPFARRLATIEKLVVRAQRMPRPRVGSNAVRAKVNGRRFASAGVGRPTPNEFTVNAGQLYLEVSCRVIDGGQVIIFRLPVMTEDVSYDVEQGLASFTYTPNIFEATPEVAATSGTFFAQRDRNEIYGVFSVAGPGLDVKDGRFRIQLPRALRGN